jgi:cation-transporting P-type ATPase 13A2
VHDVLVQRYGRSLSTVFGCTEKQYAIVDDDDYDPLLQDLRVINYRYMRFCFHPLRDKFILINGWKDPAWTSVKTIRAGIDGDEKEKREIVFGRNLIDVQEKSILQLLINEVGLALPKLC